MRRRLMMFKRGQTISGKDSAVAGDILCANSVGSKMVVKAADYASIPSGYEAIGVVVIPPSHDVYGTGEGAAMSLKYMSPSYPDTGTDSVYYANVAWGYSGDSGLKYLLDIVKTNNSATSPSLSFITNGTFPTDKAYIGDQCATDPVSWYYSTSGQIPSPYLKDGSRNEQYIYTKNGLVDTNALSYFDGKERTLHLINRVSGQPSWRTDPTIENEYESGYYPAACCCWRYHTVGTKQGDWYLPTIAELGYLIVRCNTIWSVTVNTIGINDIFYSLRLYASTEPNINNAHIALAMNGKYQCTFNSKASAHAVAFIRF